MSEQQPWEQMEGEPLLWYKRFTRFRLMEPVRSIAAVFHEEKASKNPEKPRRNPDNDWYEAAKQWSWEERASAWDAVQIAHLEQSIASEKARVLLEGYAVMHRRVARLNAEVEQLLTYAQDESKVWMADVKAVGFERVDLVQFNASLFHEIREHFADIAAELGERIKKKEVSYKELPPDVYVGITEDDEGSEP